VAFAFGRKLLIGGRKMKRSIQFKAASVIALAIIAYIGSYAIVRQTHTKWWFDKTTEERGPYTFFDTWSKFDVGLCFVYRPLLALDLKLNQRVWILDKW
jgi:hypothetical protein